VKHSNCSSTYLWYWACIKWCKHKPSTCMDSR